MDSTFLAGLRGRRSPLRCARARARLSQGRTGRRSCMRSAATSMPASSIASMTKPLTATLAARPARPRRPDRGLARRRPGAAPARPPERLRLRAPGRRDSSATATTRSRQRWRSCRAFPGWSGSTRPGRMRTPATGWPAGSPPRPPDAATRTRFGATCCRPPAWRAPRSTARIFPAPAAARATTPTRATGDRRVGSSPTSRTSCASGAGSSPSAGRTRSGDRSRSR